MLVVDRVLDPLPRRYQPVLKVFPSVKCIFCKFRVNEVSTAAGDIGVSVRGGGPTVVRLPVVVVFGRWRVSPP